MAGRHEGERIVWQPNSKPQYDFLRSSVPDVFFGGARGGGKTDALIGDFIAHAGEHGKRAKGILVRRTMDELEEVQLRCRKYLGGLGWTCSGQKPTWTAPNGATLKLRYLERDEDAERYQGHEYTWVGVDEAGNFASSGPIDLLCGTLRPTGTPTFSRLTGNPGGPGHQWLKKRYIDAAKPGTPFPDNDARVWRLFIPSSFRDNPNVDPTYEDKLYAATVGKPWLRKNWLDGDWDAVPDAQPFKSVHYCSGLPDNLKIFWVVDMAYTQKKTSDYTAGLVWGADSDWNLYELEYYEETATAAERLDYLFKTARFYQESGHDVVLNLEAHPDWFAHILPQEMDLRRFDFAVNKLSPKGVSKDDRIRDNVSRWIDRLFFRPGSKLAQRVLNYQGGRDVNGEPDDGPDGLAYLTMEADRAARQRPPEEQYDYVTAEKIRRIQRKLHGPKTSFEVTR
jgi:hypothetical protein